MPSRTQRERQAERRKAKLDHVQAEVDAGSLVIRKMTDAERGGLQAPPAQRGRSRARTRAAARAPQRGRCRPYRAAKPPRRAFHAAERCDFGRASRVGAGHGLRAVDRGRRRARHAGLDRAARRAATGAARADSAPATPGAAAPRVTLRPDDHGRRRRRVHRARARGGRARGSPPRRGRGGAFRSRSRRSRTTCSRASPSDPTSGGNPTDEDARTATRRCAPHWPSSRHDSLPGHEARLLPRPRRRTSRTARCATVAS